MISVTNTFNQVLWKEAKQNKTKTRKKTLCGKGA